MQTPIEQRRLSLKAMLPELRDAMQTGDPIKPVLYAHAFSKSILPMLSQLGAIKQAAPGTPRFRRWKWVSQRPDEQIIEDLLQRPELSIPDRYPSGTFRIPRQSVNCYRCDKPQPVTRPILRQDGPKGWRYICTACRTITDEPRHERELAMLTERLQRLHLLWPEELLTFATDLRRIGTLCLRAARATRPGRSKLGQLGRDLREIADWLQAADRKLTPIRLGLLTGEGIESLPVCYELAEVVAEDPRSLQLPADRATAESTLLRRAATLRRREAADLLHDGLLHATSWLKSLEKRLKWRRLELEKPSPRYA